MMRLTLAVLLVAVTVAVHALPTNSAPKLMVRSPDFDQVSMSQKAEEESKKSSESNYERLSSTDGPPKVEPAASVATQQGANTASSFESQKQSAASTMEKQQATTSALGSTSKPSFGVTGDAAKIDSSVDQQIGSTKDEAAKIASSVNQQIGDTKNEAAQTASGVAKQVNQVGGSIDQVTQAANKKVDQIGSQVDGTINKATSGLAIGQGNSRTEGSSSGFEKKESQSNAQASGFQFATKSSVAKFDSTASFFNKQNIQAFKADSSNFQYRDARSISTDLNNFSSGFGTLATNFQSSSWTRTQTYSFLSEASYNFNILSQRFVDYDFSRGVEGDFVQQYTVGLLQYLQRTQQFLSLIITRFGVDSTFANPFAETWAALQRCIAIAIQLRIDLTSIFRQLDLNIFQRCNLRIDSFQNADVTILKRAGYQYNASFSTSSTTATSSSGATAQAFRS